MTKGDKELALVFGGAGALLLAYLFWPKKTTAQYAPPVSSPQGSLLQNTALPQSTDVTVVNGGNLSIAVDVGTVVIVWLPLGGRWVSLDGAGITDPVSPLAFNFAGPITHIYVWSVANQTQTCTIAYSVGVSTPVVVTT